MINVVLYQPQKPLNTGNIMRTCRVSDVKLHIIGPLTFKLDDDVNLKRAGLDYLKDFKYQYYEDYEDFKSKNGDKKISYITRYGKKIYTKIKYNYKKDLYLMFGNEGSGIPKDILKEHIKYTYRIPMLKDQRSLNLSNSVAIVVYRILEKAKFRNLAFYETIKGKDFLDKD